MGITKGFLYDENHTEISSLNEGSVIMYTCDSSGNDKILLTFWDQVDDFNWLAKNNLRNSQKAKKERLQIFLKPLFLRKINFPQSYQILLLLWLLFLTRQQHSIPEE